MNVAVQIYRDTVPDAEESFPLHWLTGGHVTVNVPRRLDGKADAPLCYADGYRLDLDSPLANVAPGWLYFTAQLYTLSGTLCGARVPAYLYMAPWDVPSVVRFPQTVGLSSVWTVTLRVV